MRLTIPLRGHSLIWMRKKLWLERGRYREPRLKIPKVLEEKGVKVLDVKPDHFSPLEKPEPWVPPRPDPRFSPPVSEKDNPDWHENPVYEFNHGCRLLEGEKQALILTKSKPHYCLPQKVGDLVGKVSLPYQDELVQRIIMQANKWDPTKDKLPRRVNKNLPIWRFKAEWGIPKERMISIMIKNLVRLCRSIAAYHGALLDDRCISHDHQVSTFYSFQGDKHIQLTGNHNCLVSSSQPLQIFAMEEEIDATVTYRLPDIFPVAPTIDLAHKHVWREENITGWRDGFSKPHPHTVLFANPEPWKVEELNARALMYCLAYTTAQAKQRFGWEVEQLPEPVCIQCVHTDGIKFHIVCFQLNTLNMHSANGIKNMVWFDNNNAMYNKIEPKRAMLRNTRYEDYDPGVFEKLLALYINNTALSNASAASLPEAKAIHG